METKHNDPKLTQKQIAQLLGFSDSTINSYKDKIGMPSPIIKKLIRKIGFSRLFYKFIQNETWQNCYY